MLSFLKNTKGEVSTLVVVGLFAVIAAAAFVTTSLNQERRTTSTRAGNDTAATSCPYDSGASIQLGQTESNAANMENRWPISQHPHEYDILGPGYFNLEPNTDEGILNLTKTDGGAVDSKMNNFMGSMFGFKPKKLAAAYNVAYGGSVPQGRDTRIKGDAPVLEVPVDPSDPTVRVPSTGYDIGGGYEAMVVFAAADRVTLHIGRHEYFVGSGGNNCNGGSCSGGYWIYVKGICVDQKILQAYQSVEGAQKAAGADKNPIQLPMLQPGQVLGKATAGKVLVGVRDNGPFISTFKSVYWGGVPEKDTLASNPPGGNVGVTSTPDIQATPTIKPGITCGHPGYQCCNPANPDTASIGASCVAGSTCQAGTCVAIATPTPPTSNPTTAPTAPTATVPTATQQSCPGVGINNAVYKHDASGKITFFRVVLLQRADNLGPKVSQADDSGKKIEATHIVGPSYGGSQWEESQLPYMSIGEGESKNYYLEVEVKNEPNRICAQLAVTCERGEGSPVDTELVCNPMNSQTTTSRTSLTTTQEVKSAGKIGMTADGEIAIIPGQGI